VDAERVEDPPAQPTNRRGRAIGTIGTIARLIVGLAFIALAFLTGEFELYSLPLGLVGFPAVVLLLQWLRARWAPGRLEATGSLGFCLNILIALPFFIFSYTQAAAFLFYGASMLLAAARGYAGCEVTAISNWLLRRDDQVGCMIFSPIDTGEARAKEASPAA
jgi:hypothetical protein